jgi:hypothetical protein
VDVLDAAARRWAWAHGWSTLRIFGVERAPCQRAWPEQTVSFRIAFVVRRVPVLCAAAAAAAGRDKPNVIWRWQILGYGVFREDDNVQGVLRKHTMDQAGVFLQNAWYSLETDRYHTFQIQRYMYEFAGFHYNSVSTGYFLSSVEWHYKIFQ